MRIAVKETPVYHFLELSDRGLLKECYECKYLTKTI